MSTVGSSRMGRHRAIERPPVGRMIRIQLRGTTYEGSYTVDGPVVAVEALAFGSKRRYLTDSPPEVLASCCSQSLWTSESAAAARPLDVSPVSL